MIVYLVGLSKGTSSDVDRTLNLDSFLFPLIEDLKTLAVEGVRARRWVGEKLVSFDLRGHLILVNGDMPATAKVRHALEARLIQGRG